MAFKEARPILMFQGDTAQYELEDDFAGVVGNLVNLEDFDLTVAPAGKFRIMSKDVTPVAGEPTRIVYHLARF